MKRLEIFTIGHSNHPADYFLELLQHFSITCVVDVRSTAASRHFPQFNKNRLEAFLQAAGIQYLHFAREFGARQTDPLLLDDAGQVDFAKVQQSAAFRSGVTRLRTGVEKGFRIALMCAEAEPLECHRFGMISGYLQENGFDVQHILKDKTRLSQSELEERLLKKFTRRLDPAAWPGVQLQQAYHFLNQAIGFKPATS